MPNPNQREEREKAGKKRPAPAPKPKAPAADPSVGGAVQAIKDRKKLLDEI